VRQSSRIFSNKLNLSEQFLHGRRVLGMTVAFVLFLLASRGPRLSTDCKLSSDSQYEEGLPTPAIAAMLCSAILGQSIKLAGIPVLSSRSRMMRFLAAAEFNAPGWR